MLWLTFKKCLMYLGYLHRSAPMFCFKSAWISWRHLMLNDMNYNCGIIGPKLLFYHKYLILKCGLKKIAQMLFFILLVKERLHKIYFVCFLCFFCFVLFLVHCKRCRKLNYNNSFYRLSEFRDTCHILHIWQRIPVKAQT